jgi:hypothetical protein
MSIENESENECVVVDNITDIIPKKNNILKTTDFSSNDNTISTNNTKIFLAKNTLNSLRTIENCRLDAFGNKIIKGNKKNYKVTFVDQVDENKDLIEEISVENFKKYNVLMAFSQDDKVEEHGCCTTCLIF